MQDLKRIRKQLPRGAQKEIAEKLKISPIEVHRILNGKGENLEILSAVADYLADLKSKRDAINNRFASLLN